MTAVIIITIIFFFIITVSLALLSLLNVKKCLGVNFTSRESDFIKLLQDQKTPAGWQQQMASTRQHLENIKIIYLEFLSPLPDIVLY